MRARLLCGIVFPAVLGLAACSGGGGGGLEGTPREFTRQDGDVTVTPNLGVETSYTATQIVSISNDDAGAMRVVSSWENTSGSIVSSPASNGYQVQVTLTATAPSEAQARALLATMHVSHRDAVGGSTLYLDHEVRFDEVSGSNVQRNAAVAAALPATLEHELYQHLVGGSNASSGLGGPLAHFEGVGGTITVSGTWEDNVLETIGGTIDVTVPQALGAGYDLEALAMSGTTTVAVAGTSPVGEQTMTHKHYRSPDYASAEPRFDVYAHAIGGTITIHD